MEPCSALLSAHRRVALEPGGTGARVALALARRASAAEARLSSPTAPRRLPGPPRDPLAQEVGPGFK